MAKHSLQVVKTLKMPNSEEREPKDDIKGLYDNNSSA